MRDYFLKAQRIAFSHWNKDDYDLAYLLWGDEKVTKYISKTGRFSEQEIMNRLNLETKNKEQFGVQYWPIFDIDTEDFLGCCGLRPYKIENHIYEIGFHLRGEYWGKGFGYEAANAVIKYSLDTLKVSEIFAGHNPNNLKSKNLLEKLGFKYIGNEYYEPMGLYHPTYKYIMV